jgi:pyruvate,water dikinase
MFTEHPVSGADERLIEASWGLGEAVVAGLVVPDHFRLDRSGQVLERKVGRKRIAIRSLPSGGTFEQQVQPAQVNQLCLDDVQLAALGELALQCERSTARAATSNGRSRMACSICSSVAP